MSEPKRLAIQYWPIWIVPIWLVCAAAVAVAGIFYGPVYLVWEFYKLAAECEHDSLSARLQK